MKISIELDIPSEAFVLIGQGMANVHLETKDTSVAAEPEDTAAPEPEPEPEQPKAKKTTKKAPAKKKKLTKAQTEDLRVKLRGILMDLVSATDQPTTVDIIRCHLGQRISTDYVSPEDDNREPGRNPDQRWTKIDELLPEDLEPVIKFAKSKLEELAVA